MRGLTARAGLAPAARLLDGHGWAIRPTVLSIAASGTSAATTLVVAWGVGAEELGHFTVVLTIALIVSVAMLMSLNYVMYQELPRADPDRRPALVTTALFATLALTAGIAAAALLAAPVLTVLLGVDLRTLCFALALAAAITLNQLTESFLRGLKKFDLLVNLKLGTAIAYLATASAALAVGHVRDAEFYLSALIGTHLAFAVMAMAGLRVVPRTWSVARMRSLYRHGAYLTATTALVAVAFGVDVLFLNHLADRADVGVYSVYNGLPRRLLVVLLTEGLGVVLLPTLATVDKPTLLRRIGALAPAAATAMAVISFAASAVLFLVLRGDYPYSFVLMGLSAVGIGAHTVFHLYFFALSMDGLRGAKLLIGCLVAGLPVALGCQAALIAWWGVVGALVAFTVTNLLLVGVVAATAGRVYATARPSPAPAAVR